MQNQKKMKNRYINEENIIKNKIKDLDEKERELNEIFEKQKIQKMKLKIKYQK